MDNVLAQKIVNLAIGDYAPIRDEYRTRMYSAILSYLSGGNTTATRNEASRAVVDALNAAGELGYIDGGGSLDLPDPDFNAWLADKIDIELYNVKQLWTTLKEMKSDPEFTRAEAFDVANTRADGYARTLDWTYNEAKMRGAKNKMLTFGGEDGHSPGFPCKTCKRLKYREKRHRASWWVKRGLVPYPGNPNFECGAWQCKHFLYDDNGSPFTI